MTSRPLLPGEILIMRTLLDHAYEPRWKAINVESLRVSDMDDGGMGSLLFETTKPDRMFGRTLSEGWFKDEDGFPVMLCLNLDKEDDIFELDSWKVDFSPRLRLPQSQAEILSGLAKMD
ncbi:conserved hypothetical protein [Arthrobacter sp. FB24]|uniref:DUF6984 family protein n=1 Tax=Arthrobacter sp. (strain FB24) TaxID=290399 RepID=UPI0000526F0E|nr:hypothetical protein [Arthrobacter sp. FB24]ABK02388.1 conserved hypothetical protein [Arthrobacter sp. FB24]